ncbi:MAG: hypothetical protein M3O09_07540 [Acidobacteriota bacterium]|nr:hypothetical protein [Acidobacteriota bacterium]
MQNPRQDLRRTDILLLFFLSVAAFLIHGYHPGAEDAEIYIPGVLKLLNPRLFPYNAEFFGSHAHLTLFPNLIAASIRVTHLSLETVLLLWQFASIFLLLLACWLLIGKCFRERNARWAGVSLVAALLTLPVAGTALYILDQYTNPRNLVASAGIFAINAVLEKKYFQMVLWLAVAFAVHPLMPVFVLSFCLLLIVMGSERSSSLQLAAISPLGFLFDPPSPAYHEALNSHSYFLLLRWEWYEWLGIIAPIILLWGLSRLARGNKQWTLELLCRALVIYGSIYFIGALIVAIPARLEGLSRLQPLRSLYLLYVLLVLIGGGLLGQYVLKTRVWKWLALFLPLCAGMCFAQRALFPASSHIEWPGTAPRNQWAQAFLWIRDNTPVNAFFALDPFHMRIPGEDMHGFRVMAERSMLADAVKDSGAVSMFPPLAEKWLEQVQAQSDWKEFQIPDFQRLHARYGVDWVVLQQPGISGLQCPYQNSAVVVCRI